LILDHQFKIEDADAKDTRVQFKWNQTRTIHLPISESLNLVVSNGGTRHNFRRRVRAFFFSLGAFDY